MYFSGMRRRRRLAGPARLVRSGGGLLLLFDESPPTAAARLRLEPKRISTALFGFRAFCFERREIDLAGGPFACDRRLDGRRRSGRRGHVRRLRGASLHAPHHDSEEQKTARRAPARAAFSVHLARPGSTSTS